MSVTRDFVFCTDHRFDEVAVAQKHKSNAYTTTNYVAELRDESLPMSRREEVDHRQRAADLAFVLDIVGGIDRPTFYLALI